MAYTRKTRDEYDIQQNYGYGWESVDCHDTRKEAKAALKVYRENQPNISARIKKIRVKIEEGV